MSAVEDVATAIAAAVRKHDLDVRVWAHSIFFSTRKNGTPFVTLACKDPTQAKRLAEMMRAPTPVFDAMNLPETPAFPSVRGKA